MQASPIHWIGGKNRDDAFKGRYIQRRFPHPMPVLAQSFLGKRLGEAGRRGHAEVSLEPRGNGNGSSRGKIFLFKLNLQIFRTKRTLQVHPIQFSNFSNSLGKKVIQHIGVTARTQLRVSRPHPRFSAGQQVSTGPHVHVEGRHLLGQMATSNFYVVFKMSKFNY